MTSRTQASAEGLGGGSPGAPGRFLVDDRPVSEARKMALPPESVVVLETPGGGGYGVAAAE